jgi:hypothetical protein
MGRDFSVHCKNRYQFDRRLGGPQSWSGQRGKKKNHLPLLGIESRSSSLYSDTTLAELQFFSKCSI